MKMKKPSGMTLIELLVVISIIGALSTISYKAFQNQIIAGHRTDAHTTLLAIQSSIENMLLVHNKPLSEVIASYSNQTLPSPKGYYRVTVVPTPNATNVSGYRISASACQDTVHPCKDRGQRNDTSCTTISLSSDGTKDPTTCW